MNEQPNEQPLTAEQLAEIERKKSFKTNKKIVLDEEPVLFTTPFLNNEVATLNEPQPTQPVVQEQVQPETPQVQSGNITF